MKRALLPCRPSCYDRPASVPNGRRSTVMLAHARSGVKNGASAVDLPFRPSWISVSQVMQALLPKGASDDPERLPSELALPFHPRPRPRRRGNRLRRQAGAPRPDPGHRQRRRRDRHQRSAELGPVLHAQRGADPLDWRPGGRRAVHVQLDPRRQPSVRRIARDDEQRSGKIRIFDAGGTHLRSMGGKGEGPGEFRIGRFISVLPGDTLWVGDYRPWRYHVYASTGQYIRTAKMNPQYFNASLGGGVLDNGVSVNVRDDAHERRGQDFHDPLPWFVEAHAADGTVIGELARLDSQREGTWPGAATILWTLFDPVPAVHALGTTIAIATAREPEVRLLDEELHLRRIVRWADPDREVTRAHVQAYRDGLIDRRGGRGSENWRPTDDAMISDRRRSPMSSPRSAPSRSAGWSRLGVPVSQPGAAAGAGGCSVPTPLPLPSAVRRPVVYHLRIRRRLRAGRALRRAGGRTGRDVRVAFAGSGPGRRVP